MVGLTSRDTEVQHERKTYHPNIEIGRYSDIPVGCTPELLWIKVLILKQEGTLLSYLGCGFKHFSMFIPIWGNDPN